MSTRNSTFVANNAEDTSERGSIDKSSSLLERESPPNYITFRNRMTTDDDGPVNQRDFKAFQDTMVSLLENWFEKQDSKMTTLLNEFEDMRKSMQFLSQKYDELQSKTEVISNRLSDIEKRELISDTHVKKITSLEAKIDAMEQQMRQCNIEISNVPERKGENLITLIENMGVTTKQNLSAKDVVSVHRVPHASNVSTHPKNIIVKFTTRLLRDNILSAVRMTKGIQTTSLGITGEPRQVYVNEHLTLKNKQIYREARDMAKKANFRFVWIKNGTVLVRENEASPVFSVRGTGDLDKIRSKSV